MRLAAVFALMLCLAGCIGGGWSYPAGARYPARPAAATETLDRVRDAPPRALAPISAEAGNLWPDRAAPVPTMLDILQEPPGTSRARSFVRNTAGRPRRGGYGLCLPNHAGAPAARPPGMALGLCYASAAKEPPR
jgi:hypothetical protein